MSLSDVYTMMGTIVGILAPIIIIILYVKKEICKDIQNITLDLKQLQRDVREDYRDKRQDDRDVRQDARQARQDESEQP